MNWAVDSKEMAGGDLSVISKQDFQWMMHPNHYTEMSGMMAAILGYILDADYPVEPKISSINISRTSNGGLLTTPLGYLGSVYDYILNINSLLDVNALDDEGKAAFWDIAEKKIPIRATLGIECFAKEKA